MQIGEENSEPIEQGFLGLIISEENADKVDNIRDILESYPGDAKVILAINGKKYDAKCSVRRCEGLISELKSILKDSEIIFFIKKI